MFRSFIRLLRPFTFLIAISDSDDNRTPVSRVRSLRQSQTKSEGLLWSILRASQLCGRKFRRQHAIGPFIVDFACAQERLVVEIDGDYHDAIIEQDFARERYLQTQGWRVVRFTADEVELDTEAVGRAICRHLGKDYDFHKRKQTGSGMMTMKKNDEDQGKESDG